MKLRTLLFLALSLLPGGAMMAQTNKPVITWKGRMHMDAVGYVDSPDMLNHTMDIPDLRLGAEVDYENWMLKVDVGYARNKVSLKDAFLQYAQNGHFFRAGHQYVYTGMEQPNGSNNMLFNSMSNTSQFFDSNRRLGVSYTRSAEKYYLTAGVYVGDDINVGTDKQGYSGALRVVWRPVIEEYRMFHVGVSGLYKVPDKVKGKDYKNLTLTSRGVVRAKSPYWHELPIDGAKKQILFVGELFATYNKWMVQGEYNWSRVNRIGARAYRGQGGFVEAGYLLRGEHYGYDRDEAFSTLPADNGSILLVARYNNTKANDHKAGLMAGDEQDFSIGLDYFYNKYISTRLGYSYVKLDEYSAIGKCDVHVIQARLQVKF